MNKSLSRYAAAVALNIGVHGLAEAQPTYSVTPILPEISDRQGLVLAGFLNDRGEVLGSVSEGSFDEALPLRDFIWREGEVVYLSRNEPDSLGLINDFNNAGHIAGTVDGPGGRGIHAVIWADGEPELLEELPDEYPTSIAWGLNDKGDAVGISRVDGAMPMVGLYDPGRSLPVAWVDGAVLELETLPDSLEDVTRPVDINNAGMIIGTTQVSEGDQGETRRVSHSLVWHEGQLNDIGSFAPGGSTEATALNDAGQVVGSSEYHIDDGESVRKAFIWQHGAMEALAPLNSTLDSEALDINSHGHVVGAQESGEADTAFLWTPESGMVDLNTLVNAHDLGEGVKLSVAMAINDEGQILVGGYRADRTITSYLLTPRTTQPGDEDNDGVPDSMDKCDLTDEGQVVNAAGCSIAQLVPCDGPADGGQWWSSLGYLRALRNEASAFVSDGLISRSDLVALLREGRQAGCGRRGWVTF